ALLGHPSGHITVGGRIEIEAISEIAQGPVYLRDLAMVEGVELVSGDHDFGFAFIDECRPRAIQLSRPGIGCCDPEGVDQFDSDVLGLILDIAEYASEEIVLVS